MVRRASLLAAIAAALLGAARPAAAADPNVRSVAPERVQGVIRPAREAGEILRDLEEAMLFLPRRTIEVFFLATGAAAGIIRDEQVVPRVNDLVNPPPGALTVFPTVFADSGQRPSLGARMIANGGNIATTVGVGFGGFKDANTEARIRIATPKPIPIVLDLEGYADSRSQLAYDGRGEQPETDPRNHFRAGVSAREALYLEARSRTIVGLGVRASEDLELFVSGSFTRSQIEPSPGNEALALDRVFEPGSVPGAVPTLRLLYGEFALRLDTRPVLGRPTAGALLESYGGLAVGTGDDPSEFVRLGGRAALYIPVKRPTNILSPKIAVDALSAISPSRAAIPFTALVNLPDFRGFDTRRDNLGVVASLDYRWSLMRYLGARLFVDVATVAPESSKLFDAPPRVAGGFGLDLFSDSTEIGQLALAISNEGARVLLSFGVSSVFGDRQHRR